MLSIYERILLLIQGYTLENTFADYLFVLLILVHLHGDILIFYFLWNQQHNITVVIKGFLLLICHCTYPQRRPDILCCLHTTVNCTTLQMYL